MVGTRHGLAIFTAEQKLSCFLRRPVAQPRQHQTLGTGRTDYRIRLRRNHSGLRRRCSQHPAFVDRPRRRPVQPGRIQQRRLLLRHACANQRWKHLARTLPQRLDRQRPRTAPETRILPGIRLYSRHHCPP